ncbi:DNA-packaging protein [Chitinophaga agrisoli]|uniref:DNA-packaging protein n=1 Tax=Chitinophaga agrisoli TaxID=2607653 RepID=A0A5B2VVR8_9BACT|nr:DNA-packaging protein [Chitinophaga agrisoli]KAA2242824.1 DNA-packaging protein [Chitinophaga agrisoli]
MGAPLGNQFWKQRSKHGRDKIFSSPEDLWAAACEYFEWVDNNPLIAIEFYGRDAERCEVEKMRPYTWDGLETFLDIDSLREYKTNETYKAFSQVITRIGKIIYTQKFEGAAAGLLHANIIARDLGLADKKEVEQKTIIVETPDDDE